MYNLSSADITPSELITYMVVNICVTFFCILLVVFYTSFN